MNRFIVITSIIDICCYCRSLPSMMLLVPFLLLFILLGHSSSLELLTIGTKLLVLMICFEILLILMLLPSQKSFSLIGLLMHASTMVDTITAVVVLFIFFSLYCIFFLMLLLNIIGIVAAAMLLVLAIIFDIIGSGNKTFLSSVILQMPIL